MRSAPTFALIIEVVLFAAAIENAMIRGHPRMTVGVLGKQEKTGDCINLIVIQRQRCETATALR